MAAIKPEVTITKEGKSFVQTNVTPWKTTASKMTPGETLDADMFATGTNIQVRKISHQGCHMCCCQPNVVLAAYNWQKNRSNSTVG